MYYTALKLLILGIILKITLVWAAIFYYSLTGGGLSAHEMIMTFRCLMIYELIFSPDRLFELTSDPFNLLGYQVEMGSYYIGYALYMGAKTRAQRRIKILSPLVASFGIAAIPLVLLGSHEHLSITGPWRSIADVVEFSKWFFKFGGINIVAAVYQLLCRLFAEKEGEIQYKRMDRAIFFLNCVFFIVLLQEIISDIQRRFSFV